jgi:hypothetical protein
MGETSSTHEVNEKEIQNFSRMPQRKRQVGRHGHSWEDNIKMSI